MMNQHCGKKSLSNEIELWIDLGQPDEKRIQKSLADVLMK